MKLYKITGKPILKIGKLSFHDYEEEFWAFQKETGYVSKIKLSSTTT